MRDLLPELDGLSSIIGAIQAWKAEQTNKTAFSGGLRTAVQTRNAMIYLANGNSERKSSIAQAVRHVLVEQAGMIDDQSAEVSQKPDTDRPKSTGNSFLQVETSISLCVVTSRMIKLGQIRQEAFSRDPERRECRQARRCLRTHAM